MKIKYVISASAAALGLMLAGGAFAQTTQADHGGSASATNVSIPGLNGNTLLSNNTENVNKTIDSNNSFGLSFTKTVDVNKTYNIRKIEADQDLHADVSGVSYDGAGHVHGDDNRNLNTGSISWSGGAFQGVAGIQTSSTNTGLASANQAATMVSANANVTFGP